jgi:hypothetical protein
MADLPPPVGPVPAPQKKSNEATWMMIGGGAGAVVAAFLPWYSVGLFTVNGTGGDGQITLVLGGLLALFGFLRHTGRSSPIWAAIIVAGLITAIGGYHYLDNSGEELISVGIGVYGTVAAGIVGFVGALIARQYPTAPEVVAPVVAVAPGWHADPIGSAVLRYWDGAGWTEHTTEELGGGPPVAPVAQSGDKQADARVPTSVKFAALRSWQKALVIVGVGLTGGLILTVVQSL